MATGTIVMGARDSMRTTFSSTAATEQCLLTVTSAASTHCARHDRLALRLAIAHAVDRTRFSHGVAK